MALDPTYLQVSDGTGDAALMHVTAGRSIGGTVITVDTVVGVPAKFIAVSGTLLPTGFMDPATLTNFYGHVSGSTLIIEGFCDGSADAGNTIGQVVAIKPNTVWANMVATLIRSMNPVGSLYFNASDNTNPATLLGFGTWVAFGAGQVPVGYKSGDADFGTIGQTGGQKTVNLQHGHIVNNHGHPIAAGSTLNILTGTGNQIFKITSGPNSGQIQFDNGGGSQTGVQVVTSTGDASPGTDQVLSSSQSVLSPYITVYIWKRTA